MIHVDIKGEHLKEAKFIGYMPNLLTEYSFIGLRLLEELSTAISEEEAIEELKENFMASVKAFYSCKEVTNNDK